MGAYKYKVTMTNKIVKIGKMVGKTTSAVKAAAEALAAGEVIAVPTDTIYGIAALVQNKEAVEKLYKIKKRNPSKPIAICVGEIEDIYNWAQVTVAKEVIEDLLPGQVTLVFKRAELLNNNFNPDTDLVGVRIPDYPFLRDVCSMSSSPLALTSANYSADTSTLQVETFTIFRPGSVKEHVEKIMKLHGLQQR